MAYVRLDDSVMDNPKMLALTDRAFRGWVWGLCYAQRHLTDGFLPLAALTFAVKRAAGELQARGLWEVVDKGFQIHDYLKHQDSKEEVEARKANARDRQRNRRSGSDRRVTPPVTRDTPRTSDVTHALPSLHLHSSLRSEGEKDRGIGERAATLLQELYPRWYSQYRHGAKLKLVASTIDYQHALTICETWDDARIEKLARVFLTTDEAWIAGTDRSFRVFAARASWADDRLTQAEKAAV